MKALWANRTNRHIAILAIALLLLILFLKNRFDYKEYERQWEFFLNGGNPWDYGSNAYGPFHIVMAFFYQLHSKLPRLIFSVSAFASSVYLVKRINRNEILSPKIKNRLTFLLLYNPILWIFFVINGCNDGIVGFFFLFGIILYDRKKFIASAILIGSAILYKYIPIFILPILCVNHKKINWKFSLSTLSFLGIGFGTSYYFWGDKFLNPIFFNSARESKILSVFRYFRGDYSFLKFVGIENLDYLSAYLVVFSVVAVFIIHLIYNWDYLKSLIVTMLFVYLFYLVGHFQYYISIYLLIFYYLSKQVDSFKHHQAFRTFSVFIYWIFSTTLLYGITEGFYRRFFIIREFIGLPHFAILLYTIITFLTINKRLEQNNKSAVSTS